MGLLKGHCGVHATLTMHMSAGLHSPCFEGLKKATIYASRVFF